MKENSSSRLIRGQPAQEPLYLIMPARSSVWQAGSTGRSIRNGWVEHDPEEIWQNQKDVLNEAIEKADSLEEILRLALPTNVKPLSYGIKTPESRYTTPLSGNAAELLTCVEN